MIPYSRRRKRLVVLRWLFQAAAFGILCCCTPKAAVALVAPSRCHCRYDISFRSLSSSLAHHPSENEDLSSVSSSPSSIEAAQKALRQSNVKLAEEHLLQAVAQVNGAVMNHPPLLKGFEDLFRTKIRINQNQQQHGDETSRIIAKASVAQDRMGLASLLTDQSKYQEAAEELKLAVESLAELTAFNLKPINWAAVDEQQQQKWQSDLDRASSLLFRTRAMVCDWTDYETSSDNLRASTRNALLPNRNRVIPSVHPFEALAWPCLSLADATKIAHAYANRAIDEAEFALWNSSLKTIEADFEIEMDWYHLKYRLPNNNVSFVRAYTTKAATHPGEGNSDTSTAPTKLLKVGYLSPDFTGKHPLAFLMQDVFRFHDTTKVQVVLYSLGGPPDDSPEVQKIIGSGDVVREWKTLEGRVETMALTIFNDHLDVIIDLCGYTGTSLVAQVMACLRGLQGNYEDWLEDSRELLMEYPDYNYNPNYQRPIHVSYMGFPGSSGAPYIDYMIADPVVVPSKFRPWYTENILYMPHCYFVNSHKHIAPSRQDDISEEESCNRDDYGLPPEPAFVFCCHSRPDKLDPSTFATWIRALQRTREEGRLLGIPDMAHAVLWLLRNGGANAQMEANLRKEALNIWKGDEKELEQAIVFCDPAPRHLHLQRLGLADVFLDTPAYNAHTVGCDCLSAGVPMISLLRPCHNDQESYQSIANDDDNDSTSNSSSEVPTEKLASRVGASLLRSALLSSMLSDALVVSSMEEYEDCMVECARSNSNTKGNDTLNFRELRKELRDQRSIAPLWDTERWVRNLETGLEAMVELRSNGSIDKTEWVHIIDYSDIYVMDYSDIDSQ